MKASNKPVIVSYLPLDNKGKPAYLELKLSQN